MTQKGERLDATAQLERAGIALGEALGQVQEARGDGFDVDEISSALASAVREVFIVQSGDLGAGKALAHINRAMDHMRRTLVLLQDPQIDDPDMARTTGNVAKILALLYPVSKTLERISAGLPPEPETPEPTRAAEPAGAGAKPEPVIPLVRRRPIAPGARPGPFGERRQGVRHAIRVDIGIYSDSNFFAGFTRDISTGGIFAATYDVLPIGAKVNVNFNLPKGPVVSLDGTVRWIREYNDANPDLVPGMGVQFEELSPEDRDAINDFMVRHPPIFYDDD